MYVGRIVAIGMNLQGHLCALYRVSSRSFPNREAKILNDEVAAILPKPGFEYEMDDNPFIAYNCLRVDRNYVVASNGIHTDILTLKLQNHYSIRDALITVLHAFDYEHDSLSTPRIAGIVQRHAQCGYMGIITKESLVVQRLKLERGRINYVATYEHNFPNESFADNRFDAETAKDACQYILGKGVFFNLRKTNNSSVCYRR